MTKNNPGRPTAVYWLYADRRNPLYVGISSHPVQRFVEHRDTKDWWPQVTHYSIRWFDTYAEAEAAEAAAIKNDGPLHNVAMQPRDDPRQKRPVLAAWKGRELMNLLVDLAAKLRPDCDDVLGDVDITSILDEVWLRAATEIFNLNGRLCPNEGHPMDLEAVVKALNDFGPLLSASADRTPMPSVEVVADAPVEPSPIQYAVPARVGSTPTPPTGPGTYPRSVTPPERPEGFDDFWRVYPKRVQKMAAQKAYAKALTKGATPSVLVEEALIYAMSMKYEDVRYIRQPAKWLNDGWWVRGRRSSTQHAVPAPEA